jgi:hypothetical protein
MNDLVEKFSGSIYEDPEKLRILLALYRNPFDGTNFPAFIKALGTYGIIPIVSGGIAVLLILFLVTRLIITEVHKHAKVQ